MTTTRRKNKKNATWLVNTSETIFITPGSPWENPYIESILGKFRDECLSLEWFPTLQVFSVTAFEKVPIYQLLMKHTLPESRYVTFNQLRLWYL